MANAELILREKIIDEVGNLVELVIWAVLGGVRYRRFIREQRLAERSRIPFTFITTTIARVLAKPSWQICC